MKKEDEPTAESAITPPLISTILESSRATVSKSKARQRYDEPPPPVLPGRWARAIAPPLGKAPGQSGWPALTAS